MIQREVQNGFRQVMLNKLIFRQVFLKTVGWFST